MIRIIQLTLICVALIILINGRQVKARCGSNERSREADSNWLACLVAENNVKDGNCPHGFTKVPTVKQCYRSGSRSPTPYKNLVCCVIGPKINMNVKQSPCVAGQSDT